MKKIDIITFHSAHNYGAMLQVYALEKVLQDMEYNVEIINYRNKTIEKNYKIIKINKDSFQKELKSIISNIIYFIKNFKRYKNFNNFMNEKLSLSIPYYSEEELKNNPPKADIYITGSDQVWNKDITTELGDSYTLNFGQDNVKRISYAASIGNKNIENKDIDEFKRKISKIDYISVREEDGKKALSKIIDKEIEVVLDPTLLLTQLQWDKEIGEKKQEKEKYILAYVVEENEEYFKIVNYLSQKTGLKIIHLGKRNKGYRNILKNAYTEGPFEFVNLIKNAEYVITTSFHATVFSIIYNKKFFIVPHSKTSSRVTNLLEKLEIKDRIYSTFENFKKIDYTFETDYNKVKEKLEKERKKSLDFLKGAIEN